MARKRKIDYELIMSKYVTGKYTLRELSREFNVSVGALSKFINDHDIKINEHVSSAINHATSAISELEKIINEQGVKINEHPKSNIDSSSENALQIVKDDSTQPLIKSYESDRFKTLVVNETIDIISRQNPQFARAIQTIATKGLNKCNEILDNISCDSRDIKNVFSSLKDLNETLQIIPKPPAIAQQFNFNQGKNVDKKEIVKEVKVEFINASESE